MDVKSIIFFLLLIRTIFNRSLAIEIFSDDDKFIRSKELVKNNPNGISTSEDISSISLENIDEPQDHKIPYSEHEHSKKDVPTKPKYFAPGEWAKPSKEKNISIDFVPTKIYAQVRETHTIKRAPREEAIEEADTDEEKLNALRLREVVKNSKVNTVYSEEGYEDSAYDHAGHTRDADFHENFDRNLSNRLKEKRGEERMISDVPTSHEDNHNENDENDEENSRENYLESNFNPKLIVRNEIEMLEKDLEREAEEVEDNSDISLFDSKKLTKSTSSDGKSTANNKISTNENNNHDRQEVETEKENIYNKNPTDPITNVTTVYNNPEGTIADRSKENLSTSDYGKIVWEFLKTTTNDPLNEQEITLARKEATTLSPNMQSPMLITTMPLTLPGSYFLPTIKETVTLPTVYQTSHNYLPRGLNSETVNAGHVTSIAQNNDQIWPIRTNVVNYVELTDDPTIRSVISDTSSPWKPSTHGKTDRSSSKNLYDLALINESIVSPTTISPEENQTGNFQSDDVKIDDNNENYFSNPFIDRKKIKYKVLGRHKLRKSTKPSTFPQSRKENDHNDRSNYVRYNKNVNDQRAKYTKVLNYVMNQDRSKESNDFTNARGPNEAKYFDFRVEDRPTAGSELAIVDQSSVPIESETIMREPNDKNFPWNRPISSVDSFLGTSSLPIYKIDSSSLLGLSPPPPLPLSTQLLPPSNYRNGYRYLSFPYNNEGGYYRNIEPILKYAPVIVDLKRKSRTRRKRTAEYVKGEINNGTTNREEINQDNDNIFRVTKDGRNSRVTEGSRNNDYYEERTRQRTISESLDDKKPHEELLNESPKITTLVLEKEIEERFNKDNEKLENQSKDDEVNVEVEIPTNYDYVEELANQKAEKFPVVEETTEIDLKKYPFYKNERISDLSGLKYALNPGKVPRKTSTGMEFYDSRDVYKHCEEVDADLDEVPPKEERPSNDRDPGIQKPRLRGLGEKLDCFKAKYFDENPFDNPLFMEKNVGDPNLPRELDPKKLSKRVLVLPIGTSEEYIPEKLSRKPEIDTYHPYIKRNSKGERRVKENNRSKKERISASLELSPVPYHRQVYEDVMNNIKESADIYRNHRMTTISPSILTESISADSTNVKTFANISSTNKTNLSDIETDSNTTRIDGLLPPKGPNDFGKINGPRRNRITRKSRRRPSLYHVPRTIRRYHKITIQKRSIEKPIGDSKLVDLIAEKNGNKNIKNVTEIFNTTFRPRRRKFSVASKNLTSSPDDLEKDSSSRIVYTIRDRIKHSKPKDELKNVGKFTRESRTLDEDSRRKEPRYNSVERKSNSLDSSTVPTILSTILSDNINASETTTPSMISNKRLLYSTLSRDRMRMDSEEYPSEKESITKDKNDYEVHENIDDISTSPLAILSTTSSKYSDHLTSDPPIYYGAFSEETTISPIVEETRSKVSNGDHDEDFKSNERTHESVEDSSEKENDEEDNRILKTKGRDVSNEEDKRFFSRYSSRPYSPSENYEDEKYSELGSRINKPAFYHPPFSMLGYEISSISPFEESSEESSSDENEKRTRYTSFPWSSDEKGRYKNSFEESKSIPFWSYEFPWEKRERLARERRREKKNYGRFDDFSSRDSNEDVSSSKDAHTRFYPWDLYNISPSKKQRIDKRGRYFDTEESSSLHKPVKYSSKYNSSDLKSSQSINNNFNHIHVNPEKLKRKKDQTGSSNYRRIITGTLMPEDITLKTPRKEIEKRRMIEENNPIEVISVATMKHKNRKNTTKKEILKKGQVESTTLRFPIKAETTIKLNKVTDRPVDRSRRRRILKKNSQIKDSTKPVKEQVKRRKIRSTTTAPTTITTTTTTTTLVSTKNLIRRRPQTRYQKTNNQFSKMKDNLPTPTTTTVEHHSRVSKESFIRTTYPDNENSTIDSNDDSETPETKRYNENNEIDRNRGNITSENVERISMTTKETPDHVYRTKKIDKDGVKEMFISIEPNKAKNITQLDDSYISEFGKENDNWGISQDLDLSSIPSTEVSSLDRDGVVRLTEHSSSNIRSTVSWISENYDY